MEVDAVIVVHNVRVNLLPLGCELHADTRRPYTHYSAGFYRAGKSGERHCTRWFHEAGAGNAGCDTALIQWGALACPSFSVRFKRDDVGTSEAERQAAGRSGDTIAEGMNAPAALYHDGPTVDATLRVRSKTGHPLMVGVAAFNDQIAQARTESERGGKSAYPTAAAPRLPFGGALQHVVTAEDKTFVVDFAACVNSPSRTAEHVVALSLPPVSASSAGATRPRGNEAAPFALDVPQALYLEFSTSCVSLEAVGKQRSGRAASLAPIQMEDHAAADSKVSKDQEGPVTPEDAKSLWRKAQPFLSRHAFAAHYHEYVILLEGAVLDVTAARPRAAKYGLSFIVDTADGVRSDALPHVYNFLQTPPAEPDNTGAVICSFCAPPSPTTQEDEPQSQTPKPPVSWAICSVDSESYSNTALGPRELCSTRFKTNDLGRCKSTLKAQLVFAVVRVANEHDTQWVSEAATPQAIDLAEEVINIENYPPEGREYVVSFPGGEVLRFWLRRRCFEAPDLHACPLLTPTTDAAAMDTLPQPREKEDLAPAEDEASPPQVPPPLPPAAAAAVPPMVEGATLQRISTPSEFSEVSTSFGAEPVTSN